MPMDLGETIQFGDRPWHLEREARTVADELIIYDRALSATEVELLYRRPAIDGLSIAAQPHFLKGYVTAYVDPWDLQDDAQVSVKLVTDGSLAAVTQVAARVSPGADLIAVKVPLNSRAVIIVSDLGINHASVAWRRPGFSACEWRTARTG